MVDGDRTPNEQLETLKREMEEVISDMEEDWNDLFTKFEDVEEAGGARDEEKIGITRQRCEMERELAEADAKLHVILQAISVMEKGEEQELPKNIEVVWRSRYWESKMSKVCNPKKRHNYVANRWT